MLAFLLFSVSFCFTLGYMQLDRLFSETKFFPKELFLCPHLPGNQILGLFFGQLIDFYSHRGKL